jgi:hypothetical protein
MVFITPRYDEAAATVSWSRTIDFLKNQQKIEYGVRNFALLDDIAALWMMLW